MRPLANSETAMRRLGLSAPTLLLLMPAIIIQALETATYPADVSALQPLAEYVRQAGAPRLRGWSGSFLDPCGQHGASCGVIPSASSAQPQYSASNHTCAWEGVTCRDWRIIALELLCNRTSLCEQPYNGPSLDLLGNLTALTSLSLHAHLTGSLPHAPGWQSLSVLDLHGNSITGTLPPQWGTQLKQLAHVDLGGNQLGGELPGEWDQLKHLQYLDLSANNLQGSIPSSWNGMISLNKLLLDNNCGLCGDVPFSSIRNSQDPSSSIPQPGPPALVTTYSTSLGGKCGLGTSTCPGYDNRTPVIIVSVVLLTVALFLLQRSLCWLHCAQQASDTSSPSINPVRPHLQESGGLVKVVHSTKHIPTYECCVELSLHEPDDYEAGEAAMDASVAACSSSAAKRQDSAATTAVTLGALPAEPTAAASGQPFIVTATGQRVSADTPPASHQEPVWCPSGGGVESSCSSLHPAFMHNVSCPPPTVIVMPKGQDLALAVPDIPVSPVPGLLCGSTSRIGSGAFVGPDIEGGGEATAGIRSGQQYGHAVPLQGVHHQAVRAAQRLIHGMCQPDAPPA